ncbi:MAG: glycosyltransferase [Solobacterium sp.]|nr:glycosyltransferase [Solobacterium sp.]
MDTPIRILHVLAAMDLAGTETLLMNFYRNINREKVQFDFAVSAIAECAYDKEIEELGGRIFHYPRYRGKNHFAYKKWWESFFDEHPEYHIVHGHIGSTAAIYLSIARKKGRYTIAHSHSTNAVASVQHIIYKLFSFPTRYVADFYFGCSRRALIDRYGLRIANDKEKSKVLNNAIDAQKFIFNDEVRKQERAKLKLPEKKLVLGTVGRLSAQKNPYEIVRICDYLKRKGVDYRFLWYGVGELKEDITKELKEKNLNDIVYLCGTRLDIYNALQAMDIFIFPSIFEGLGISCVEAQAAGLPTLCSDTIPIEAKVTNLAKFLKLNDTNRWCTEVEMISNEINEENYKRPNTYQAVVAAGYDVIDLAKWLENFYMMKW